MRIAVNTRMLLPGQLEGVGVYTDEIISRMTQRHPDDGFYLYFDRQPPDHFTYGPNVTRTAVFPQARHPFLFYMWFQQTLRRQVEKLYPDIFFSPDGFMPLGMKVPSVITIHDPAVLRYPGHIGLLARKYYQHYVPRFAREARHIITVSEFSKREIMELLDIPPDKISVIYNGVSSRFRPVTGNEKAESQQMFANGKPYALYLGAIHPRKNIARLIRGFDLFKNANPDSELQLVVAGKLSWRFDDVIDAHENSRYKADIHMAGFVEGNKVPRLVAGATCSTYVSYYEGFGLPVLESMASGVPVITSESSAMAEISGNAALLVDPFDPDSIANGFEVLTCDPGRYQQLVESGLQHVKLFGWEQAAEATYRVLERCAEA